MLLIRIQPGSGFKNQNSGSVSRFNVFRSTTLVSTVLRNIENKLHIYVYLAGGGAVQAADEEGASADQEDVLGHGAGHLLWHHFPCSLCRLANNLLTTGSSWFVVNFPSGKAFSWKVLMKVSHRSFSWKFLLKISLRSFSWKFLVEVSRGSFSWKFWKFLLEVFLRSFLWKFLVEVSHGSFWWKFLMEVFKDTGYLYLCSKCCRSQNKLVALLFT